MNQKNRIRLKSKLCGAEAGLFLAVKLRGLDKYDVSCATCEQTCPIYPLGKGFVKEKAEKAAEIPRRWFSLRAGANICQHWI